jgi:hypothetical protein
MTERVFKTSNAFPHPPFRSTSIHFLIVNQFYKPPLIPTTTPSNMKLIMSVMYSVAAAFLVTDDEDDSDAVAGRGGYN